MHSTFEPSKLANTVQQIFDMVHGQTVMLTLPAPDSPVLPGIAWGLAECAFTPAFWAAQAWFERDIDITTEFRWGPTLIEELVGCLLGGHSITWEMNHAAFTQLSAAGFLNARRVTVNALVDCLSGPFEIHGRTVRYRFPKQKGAFIAEAINRLTAETAPIHSPLLFRKWLVGFRGIGPKTASWITRNYLNYSRVAVIDVHLFRAGVLMGIFSGNEDIGRDYDRLEAIYLALADALGVDPQRLDAVIWKTMRKSGRFARNLRSAAV